MDVSDQKQPGGTELMNTVVSLTGLPAPMVQKELEGILEEAGCAPESLTLDALRTALLNYLETLQAEIEAEESSKEATDSQVSSRLNAILSSD